MADDNDIDVVAIQTTTTVASNETSLGEIDANMKALMVNTDAFFLIINGIIVFLMQIGFAFLEAGAIRYAPVTIIKAGPFRHS